MRQITKRATLDNLDGPPGSAVFVISTPNVDRDRDTVHLTEESFRNWEAAGAPWLVGHESGKIGVATSVDDAGRLHVWQSGGKWFARCFFDLDDEDSARAYQALKTRRLGACSVAFVPSDSRPRRGGGSDHQGCDISEISLTPVPANPEATLVEVKSYGGAREEIEARYAKVGCGTCEGLPQVLAALYSHAKSEAEYLDRYGVSLGSPVRRQVEGRLEDIRRRFREEAPDGDLDEEVQKLAEMGAEGMEFQTGEAALVDQGRVPPEQVRRKLRQVVASMERAYLPRRVSPAVERKLSQVVGVMKKCRYNV